MKILFIVDTLASGGAGRVVAELANEMEKAGDVISVCTFESYDETYELYEEIEHIDGASICPGKKMSFLQKILFLRSLIHEQMYGCVISFLTKNNVAAVIAAMYTGTYVIVSERNNPANEKISFRDALLRKLLYPKYADGYVFQTEDIKNWFPKSVQDYSIVIGNPIDPDIPEPFTGEKKKRIVMSGRLEAQKNYAMAIDAFASISPSFPDYSMDIYGDGKLKSEIQKKIDACGMSKKIFLRGHTDRHCSVIADASLYVMSSDYEGMSNALMEAMAMGLPVISTDHGGGGARALIEDGVNGLLVPVNNSAKLATAMSQVLSNENLRTKLSENALQIREKFNAELIARKWKKYIERVMK